MKGDRRRPAQPDPDASVGLVWRDALIDHTRILDAGRALVEAVGLVVNEPALAASALIAGAMGAATAPLLDPRVGVDLMRLHHQFDDVVLPGVRPAVSAHALIESRVAERRRVGESDLTIVTCTSDVHGTWRAGFLSRGPRRAHKDSADASFDESTTCDDPAFIGDGPPIHRVTFSDALRGLAARATREQDPLLVDDRVAQNAGLPRAIVPPRALALVAWTLLQSSELRAPMRLRAVHHRTIAWDDEVSVQRAPNGRACRVVDDEGALLLVARVEPA